MNNCIICFKEYEEDQVKIRCGHSFCKTCIEKWAYENNNCPVCRHEGIMFQCLHCNKVLCSKKGQTVDLCRDCEFILTDIKHEAMNKVKLLRDLERRYKKLPLWKKIRIRIKNFSILKLIKNSIKLLTQVIRIITGSYSVPDDFRGAYHIVIGIIWGLSSFAIVSIPGILPIITFGAVCLAIGNFIYGLVNTCVYQDPDELYVNNLIRPNRIQQGPDLIVPIPRNLPRDDIEVLVTRLQNLQNIQDIRDALNQVD